MFSAFRISLLLIASSCSASAAKLPANWPRCPREGDNAGCLKKSIQIALKDLVNGNKALGLIPLDPLHFDKMNIQQGGPSPVNVNMTFNNIDMLGGSGVNITSAKIDWNKYSVEIGFTLDNPLQVVGDYSMKGKVMILPVNGEGKANITLYDFSGTLKIRGKELIRNGENYFDATTSQVLVDAKRCTAHFSNLFKEVQLLGEGINQFLNENWPVIMEELRGPISDVLGKVAVGLSRQFFRRVPINSIVSS